MYWMERKWYERVNTSWYTLGIRDVFLSVYAPYTLGIREVFFLVYGWYTGLSFLVYVLTSLHKAWYTGSLWFGIRMAYAGIRCFPLSGIRTVYAGIRGCPRYRCTAPLRLHSLKWFGIRNEIPTWNWNNRPLPLHSSMETRIIGWPSTILNLF